VRGCCCFARARNRALMSSAIETFATIAAIVVAAIVVVCCTFLRCRWLWSRLFCCCDGSSRSSSPLSSSACPTFFSCCSCFSARREPKVDAAASERLLAPRHAADTDVRPSRRRRTCIKYFLTCGYCFGNARPIVPPPPPAPAAARGPPPLLLPDNGPDSALQEV